jgi:hypothetical protein
VELSLEGVARKLLDIYGTLPNRSSAATATPAAANR